MKQDESSVAAGLHAMAHMHGIEISHDPIACGCGHAHLIMQWAFRGVSLSIGSVL
jgi:hypothetical protein